ncbi:hypothetical protein Q9L58_004462 [Maublancomyces gigas]|uniref:Uncharacterized protein n=1 Tax=Discina gigas TaxID=1032678 RepID=A0ABR3GKQ2_9PEZI
MSSLGEIWSIDGSSYTTPGPYLAHLSSTAPAPADFDVWFVSNICMSRYSAYYLSRVLEAVPSSELRLRNEGLGAMYDVIRGIDTTFKGIALQRGIQLPNYPEVSADWKKELEIDYSALHAVMSAHAIPTVIRYMDYSIELIQSKGKYHWTSLVTPLSVSADMFLNSMTTGEGPAKGDTMARKALTDNDMTGPARVVREELMRIRSNKAETGWNEAEARQLTAGHFKYMGDFFAHGS